MKWLGTLCALIFLALPAWALDPNDKLDDPVLEERARGLDHEIRCVQCQSEAVASSNANWAQDARKVIRERILAGDSDAEVKAFFVERYGEFVLMDPPKTGSNLLLWLAGPAMLLLGIGVGFGFLRTRSQASTGPDVLSADEEARLQSILKSQD